MSDQSMQSSTPDGPCPHPNYRVQALKPLTKILSFGPLARKPTKVSRRAPCRAWSIDVKYRRHGLIAAKMADSGKPKALSVPIESERKPCFSTPHRVRGRLSLETLWRCRRLR